MSFLMMKKTNIKIHDENTNDKNHQRNAITSHFSSTFSICLVPIGLRTLILISNWPPTAFRPSISGNVSWSSHFVSKGLSLICTDPTHTSLRKKPTLDHISTLAGWRPGGLKSRQHDLSLRFRGTLTQWLYSGLLVSFTTALLSLKGASFG